MKQKKIFFLRTAALLLAILLMGLPANARILPDAAVESGVTVEQAGDDAETAAADTGDGAASAQIPTVRADGTYRFTGREFSAGGEIQGVFLTKVPAEIRLLLGSRVLRAGDVVAAADLGRLTLRPVLDRDAEAALCFLPIREGRAEAEDVFTLHVESARDEAPVARDGSLETWRNLPNTGRLRATDDGEGELSFTLITKPRRGTVELGQDGRFTYTPQKNKVGEDYFTFTAADAAGNVSNEARVDIRILRPRDETTFSDLPESDQFTARWMRETGLFDGERMTGRLCFGPDQTVTRGEFLCMVMRLADIDPDVGLRSSGFVDEDEAPAWMRPYLASAMRRGIVRGTSSEGGLRFCPGRPVTAAEAAVMLTRALELDGPLPVSALSDASVPAWARGAVAVVSRLTGTQTSGFTWQMPSADTVLTRRQAADLLYAASKG